jgi:hypothetical protein
MSSLHRAPAVLFTLACLALSTLQPARVGAQTTARVASQLGTTLSPGQPEEMGVGTSITGTLADPAKLAALGASGLHAGARVTVVRTTTERIRVEVDELDPVPLTKRLVLKIDAEGRLTQVTS